MAVKPDVDFDFGFTAVNAEELEVVQSTNKEMVEVSKEALTIQDKCDTLYKMIQPLLNNLQKNPEKEYIYWPNRLEKVEEFSDKINEVYRG
jgi:uncharacterized protein Yka (UPF0111/DUF47 family)